MSKKWMPYWVVPILILFAIGTVWLRLAIVRMTYSIHLTDREMNRIKQNRELLQLKVSALRSPRRLEMLARIKFKLTPPKVEQIVHFNKAELLGHP